MSGVKYSVPYSNLPLQAQQIKDELTAAFNKVLDGGRYILGPEVSAFEREFAEFCGTEHAVSVGCGTSALYLTLRAMEIGPGHEVITVPNSFAATAAAIALTGARPVFVDIGRDLNLDPEQLAAAITPRTRAIIPVHLTGRPAKMDEILEIARRHDLFVLEDAAQAVGAKLNGQTVGSMGDAACFSLHPLKNLYAYGDGGMITCNSEHLAQQLRLWRNHGLRDRDTCAFWAFNSRLDELQAAFLRIQLRHLPQRTDERRELALRYNEMLRPFVQIPEEARGEWCVFQTYVIQFDGRDELKAHLQENGVEALVHYPTPLHLQPAAESLNHIPSDFPQASRAAGRILSLPLYPGLAHEQQDRVVELIAIFCESFVPAAAFV